MTSRHRASGTFAVSGVGSACLDLNGISIPLSGEVRVDGFVRHATLRVFVPNALAKPLSHALAHPVEQIPMYRPELLRLSIKKG